MFVLLFWASAALAANVTSLSGVTSNCINTANAGNSIVMDDFTGFPRADLYGDRSQLFRGVNFTITGIGTGGTFPTPGRNGGDIGGLSGSTGDARFPQTGTPFLAVVFHTTAFCNGLPEVPVPFCSSTRNVVLRTTLNFGSQTWRFVRFDYVSVTGSQPAVVVSLDGVRATTIPGGQRRDSVLVASNVAFRELSFEVASFGDTKETFAFDNFSVFEVPLLNFIGSCSSLAPPPTPAPTRAPTPVPTPAPTPAPTPKPPSSLASTSVLLSTTDDTLSTSLLLNTTSTDVFVADADPPDDDGNLPLIIGCAVGGAVCCILVVLLIAWLLRRSRKQSGPNLAHDATTPTTSTRSNIYGTAPTTAIYSSSALEPTSTSPPTSFVYGTTAFNQLT